MENRHSGVQEYLLQLLITLPQVAPQHEYHVFYNAWQAVDLPVAVTQASDSVQVHAWRYPNKVFNAAQFGAQLWPAWPGPRWDTLLPGMDVWWVPNVRLMPLSPDQKLVVTAHDLSFERFPYFYSWQRRLWHRLMQPRQLLQRANAVVAVSEATKRDLVDLYDLAADRVSVLYSGVGGPAPNESDFPNEAVITTIRQQYDLPDRFILFLGTIEPRKNVATLIRAFTAVAGRLPHKINVMNTMPN